MLINLWATYCGPCLREFPLLNEVYEKYGDRVAFIALSTWPDDSMEAIAEYRSEHSVALPMGRDEGRELDKYVEAAGVPVTVVVDRFGNAAYCHDGAFSTAEGVGRVLDALLGDDYEKTTVLSGIPKDTSTRTYPVAAARAVYPDSGEYKKVFLHAESVPYPVAGYIVPDDSVRLRIEITAEDEGDNMILLDLYKIEARSVMSLQDPERGVFLYDQEMPDPSEEMPFTRVNLYDESVEEDAKGILVFFFRNEDGISALAKALEEGGEGGLTWEYAEEAAEDGPQAYILHVADQDGNPVEEVTVSFCTDTACKYSESDENGTITFDGAPDAYHVKIIDAPEGYSWDESYEMTTSREYGEWALRLKKD